MKKRRSLHKKGRQFHTVTDVASLLGISESSLLNEVKAAAAERSKKPIKKRRKPEKPPPPERGS